MRILKALRRGVSAYRREELRAQFETVPREELSRIASGHSIILFLLLLVAFYVAVAIFAADFDKYFPMFLALMAFVYAASLQRRLDATLELLRRDGRVPAPGP